MKSATNRNLAALLVGFIFALGLGVSGMTQPQKVIGFLNPMDWDPSLIFVMIGAISVHALLYPLISKRKSPLFDSEWHIPKSKDLNPKLIFGSALFGVGWGLAGFCPGPALTSLASGTLPPLVFVLFMILGMMTYNYLDLKTSKKGS